MFLLIKSLKSSMLEPAVFVLATNLCKFFGFLSASCCIIGSSQRLPLRAGFQTQMGATACTTYWQWAALKQSWRWICGSQGETANKNQTPKGYNPTDFIMLLSEMLSWMASLVSECFRFYGLLSSKMIKDTGGSQSSWFIDGHKQSK